MASSRGALWAAVEANGTEIQILTRTSACRPTAHGTGQDPAGTDWLGHPDGRDPVIVLGDFNARRRSVVYRRFTARLRDAQLVLHKRARRTFPARMPLLCIDHIFCSRSVDVLGVEVPRSQLVRTASDPLPLVMDIRIVEHERPGSQQRPMTILVHRDERSLTLTTLVRRCLMDGELEFEPW